MGEGEQPSLLRAMGRAINEGNDDVDDDDDGVNEDDGGVGGR